MVAIRLMLKCSHCDYEELEMLPGEHAEPMVYCPYCREAAPLRELQESATQQTQRFLDEGLPAVKINKKRYFG